MCAEAEKDNLPFDMAMLNYRIDGETNCAIMKQLKELTIPMLLVVPAYVAKTMYAKLENFGDIEWLEKPFSPSDAIQKISQVLHMEDEKISEEQQQIQFNGASVLLVEDNFINQEVACSMLEVFNVFPVIANNGKEALEFLDTQKFDLIFMDLQMPVMDGHISKPIDFNNLNRNLSKWLAPYRQE